MRILGVNIPDNKRLEVALTYIKGIGRSSSLDILKEAKVDKDTKAKDLDSKSVNVIQNIIDNKYTVEGELRQQKKQNIQRLKDIDNYRGMRHKKGLPARGQKTQKNSRTVRGNVRKTVGSGKRKVELK